MFPQTRTRGGPTSRLSVLSLLVFSILLILPTSARCQVDPCSSEVYVLCDNPLLVVPDGSGDPLGDVGLLVICRDEFGLPVSGIPASAFDIQAADTLAQSFRKPLVALLSTGFTDAEGRIFLTETFAGGGSIITGELLVIVDYIYGPIQLDCNPMPIVEIRSPDLDGDQTVGINDASLFAGCLEPNYCPEADFDNDGTVGLSDLVIMQKYVSIGLKSADAVDSPSFEESMQLAGTGEGLFNGCLQRDFDNDGLAATLRDSILALPGVPFDLSIVATGFRSLSGVSFDLTLPPGVQLNTPSCVSEEPPFALGPYQFIPCGSTSLPTTSLTVGAAGCVTTGPVFVCHFQFVSTVPQPLLTTDFGLSGTLSDCVRHPNEMEACIGSPTPCEVSQIDIGTPLSVSCPDGDLDTGDAITIILRDSNLNPVSGIAASEIELSVFDQLTGQDEGRFRLTPLLPETDVDGALPYYFEPREACRWDGCFDLLITATIENCQLVATKHVRTLNVVRWEDDPLMPLDDVVNDSDMQLVSDALFTADPCFDFFELYRCPIVTQASLDLVNTHYGHSCSITAAPAVLPSPRMVLGQNVPNPFNPSTVLTVSLTHSASSARLTVYTLDGRHVRTLWSGPLDLGQTQFTWDGMDAQARPVASGIYLAHFSSGADHASVRMVLLR